MGTVTLNSSKGRWIMAGAILASSMAFIDGTALNVVLPSLQKSLRATGPALFWILNAYLLMLASLILVGGSLGDKLGRKKIFMWGILIFTVGSGLCGMAGSVFLLMLFRMVQGIGGALMIPGSLSLISASIQDKERGRAIGTWSAATTVVTIGGPVLGGALADAGLWRYIFFINIPIGVIAFIVLALKVEESRNEAHDRSVDLPGAGAVALALAGLTFGLLRIPVAGLTDPQVCLSLGAGLLLLAAFIRIERKSTRPMVPLKLFSSAVFSGVNLLTFFLYAGLATGMLFLSLNLVQVQGYSQLQSGLTFLPFTLLMVALARYAGALSDKWGPRLLLIAGPSVAGIGLLLLATVGQTEGPAAYWKTFFPGILLFGLGMAFTVAPLTATVMGSVKERFSGVASGVNNAVTRLSNVFANAVFGALAVLFFTASLQRQLSGSPFGAAERKQMIAQAVNLGDAAVPASLEDSGSRTLALGYYHTAFIDAYARNMFLSAMLCFAGALISVIFIRNAVVTQAAD